MEWSASCRDCTAQGRARVNSAVMRLFQAGRAQLEAGNCSLNTLKHQIVELMTVPLVQVSRLALARLHCADQGTLRYAHRLGRGGGSHKEKAEAAAFLGAVLQSAPLTAALHLLPRSCPGWTGAVLQWRPS